MDKSTLVKLLTDLNADLTDSGEDQEEGFRKKFEEVSSTLSCSYDDILKNGTSSICVTDTDKHTNERKYICLNFYILELLNAELSKSDFDVLSVQEIKNVKAALRKLMLHGILTKIQPTLPHHVITQNIDTSVQGSDILYNYAILKWTISGFCNYIKYPNLRMLILPLCLQGMLVAVFQIAYCPLKKPKKTELEAKFVMTEETYVKLLEDQKSFKAILENLSHSIHPSIFIKETMVLFQANAPLWFKKAISNTLTKMMRSKKGVQHIASAMLDGSDDDTTKTWQILDVLTKLILSCRNSPHFQENICAQVLNLLRLVKATDRDLFIFERLVISCTKCLYSEDKELCKVVFVDRIMTLFLYFAYKEHQFRNDDITDELKQTVRLLHGCFADNSVNVPCLPVHLLRTFICIIFHFYHLTVESQFQETNKEVKELLIKYLQNCTELEIHQLLDNFLFGFTVADIPQFRNDVIIEIDEKIVVKNSPHAIIYATADVIDTVYNVLNVDQKVILFGYLLKCISDKEKYFPTPHNSKELLGSEDHATSTVLERLLTIHKLLSQLSENKDVQRSLRNKPDDIIEYMNNVLSSDATDSHLIFTIVMILDNLISNASRNTISKYQVLTKHLSTIASKTTEVELKCLCTKIIASLRDEKSQGSDSRCEMTQFDKALEDVYDPLLPTRGHGLLILSKLIEKKDKQAVERKQYLLNLFQLYLKDEDSFIYLNAVQGLVALANLFPDTVLETLCEEYADFSKKNDGAQETRMKLGEVLVKVVKSLGDMASKYKALLLNTFLSGTKDDDHLIRSSSLSNLGEVCRVLNYKLGTIVTEVLVCVHAIITTDKAVEARRAAVTVIRQLFVGLQTEMLAFLKEDILHIYRTLKEVYYNDEDEVMRLQAQLALEELNENMKNIVFPNQQLHCEKKIIMLD